MSSFSTVAELAYVAASRLAELVSQTCFPALRKVEDRLGREVNVTADSPEEFRKKVQSRNHFFAAVLLGRKTVCERRSE